LEYFVWAIVGIVVLLFLFREQTHRNNRKGFNDLVQAVERNRAAQRARSQSPALATSDNQRTGAPDMQFAGRAFVQIALMRGNNLAVDLHAAEQKLALAETKKGCTEHQALSARWGGVQAIHADLSMFSAGIDVFKEANAPEPYLSSAIGYLTLVMNDAPSEFVRFKTYIGKA
jgi:hypothetical protein